MTTQIDYALMAGRAYLTNRPEKANQFPAPEGWAEFLHVPDAQTPEFPVTAGFEAIAFRRLSDPNEIVISYTGTNGPGDIHADLTIAAGKFSEQLMQAALYYLDIKALAPKDAKITFTGHSLGGGLAALMSVFFALPSTTFDQAPFKNAATFVQDDCALMLKSRLEALGDKYKDGIAALTTYIAARAAAPGTIPNSGLVTTIRVDGELLDGGLGPYSPIGANNSGNYTFDHGAATWSGASVDLHSQALLTTFLQSRQSATAAGNATQTLNQVTKKLDLLRLIFVDKLFNADVNSSTENFLERLIKHEAGVRDSLGNTTLAADAMVTRFTKDLWKLAKDGGLTVNDNDVQDSTSTKLSQALIAFAMQFYYQDTANAKDKTKELFTTVDGGVSFKRTDVAANWSDAKGKTYFESYLAQSSNGLSQAERDIIKAQLPDLIQWFVQAGTSAMNATASAERALMLGAKGNDVLTGGGAADLLAGNHGNDILAGGKGNDTLLGGGGDDTYIWNDGDGNDTIVDTEGNNRLIINGTSYAFAGGTMVKDGSSNVWKDASGNVKLTHNSPWRLELSDGSVIQLGEGFDPAKWGINLETANTALNSQSDSGIAVYLNNPLIPESFQVRFGPAPLPDSVLLGAQSYTDLSAVDHWVTANDNGGKTPNDGGEIITLGNGANFVDVARSYDIYARWTPGAGQDEDVVTTGSGNDIVITGYGNDTVYTGGGDDEIYSGMLNTLQIRDPADSSSSDVVDAGDGNDKVWAGMGGDFVFGGGGIDHVMGMGGNDYISGGDGDDALDGDGAYAPDTATLDLTLFGVLLGYTTGGDDTLLGGAGNDRLIGGVGRDHLAGGSDNDVLFGDTSSYFTPGNLLWIPGQYHGDDLLEGGEGDDFLIGGGGADVLYGGDGDDTLYGDQYDFSNAPGLSDIAIEYQRSDVLDGGAGNDILCGGGGNDVLIGGANYDSLQGGLGDDIYRFNAGDLAAGGNEIIIDEGGNDRIEFTFGLGASDVRVRRSGTGLALQLSDGAGIGIKNGFEGGNGAVESVAFSGGVVWTRSDLLAAAVLTTEGDDTVETVVANSTIDGGLGNDYLFGDLWSDTLLGGDGFDTIIGGGGVDFLNGGAGDDRIYASDSGTVVIGGAGRDQLQDSNEQDITYRFGIGSDGDIIEDNGGIDTIEIGQGISPSDVVVRNGGRYFEILLSSGEWLAVLDMFSAGGTVLVKERAVEFIKFADGTIWDQAKILTQTLVSTPGNDVIYSVQTDVVVNAGEGDDKVYGGVGNDFLNGESGNDVLDGGSGNDTLFGGAGNDVLIGSKGSNVLIGGIGDDLLDTQDGSNILRFDLGFGHDSVWLGRDSGETRFEFGVGISPVDVLVRMDGWGSLSLTCRSGDSIKAPSIADQSTGTLFRTLPTVAFADGTIWTADIIREQALSGSSYMDTLYGFETADTLFGAAGDDRLYGLSGDDILDGDAGADTLDGGAGNDIYIFSRGDGRDVIGEASVDRTPGKLNILRFTHEIKVADVAVQQIGNDLRVQIAGTADQITVSSFYLEGSPANSSNPVQLIEFADGTVWDIAKIDQLVKSSINHAPVVAIPLPNRSINEDSAWSYAVPLTTFTDADPGDVLTYTATMANASMLPNWLKFNAETRTFSGTPTNADIGLLDLKVIASDTKGGIAFSAFSLTVLNTNDAPTTAARTVTTVEDSPYIFNIGDFAFTDVDAGDSLQNVVIASLPSSGTLRLNSVAVTTNLNVTTAQIAAGQLVYTPAANANGLVGSFNFQVKDAGGLASANALISVSAVAVNDLPTGVVSVSGTGTQNQKLSATNTLADMDGLGPVGYQWQMSSDGTSWSAIVGATAASLTLQESQVGKRIRAVATYTDAGGTVESIASSATATVVNVNDAPAGLVAVAGIAKQDQTLSASNTLTDADGMGTIAYQWQLSSDGITWTAISGATESTFKLGASQIGKTVRAIASYTDGHGTLESIASAATAAVASAINIVVGTAGADTLTGTIGIDQLQGLAGSDTYVVNNVGDIVIENATEGTDLVQSSVSYTLTANVENLTLTGTTDLNGIGNTLVNTITGNSANNILDGGAGADTLVGGLGNDTYLVDNSADTVTEAANAGIDSVQSSVSHTLTANVENLTLTGTTAINGTGNTLSNSILGNSAANVLNGGGGADTLAGGAGNDTYVVDNAADVVSENLNEGTDLVQSSVTYTLAANVEKLTLTGTAAINATGNALTNTLTGNTGNNILDGGAGADTMVGGTGNDTYYVDNTADVTTEAASAGTDTVISSVNWTLGTNLENLTLTGTADLSATGNTVANVLTGNSGNNTLNGGTGADTMVGGAGNDTYIVDNSADAVTEAMNAGVDIIQSSVTYTLSANVENLTLTGTTAINSTGNALNNILTGNSAANVLTGGAGNDTYVVGTGDTTVEAASAGTDTVQSAITWTLATNLENLALTGTTAINGTGNTVDNVLMGNSAANTLTGNAGNDTLNGGAGADSLVGGVGNDTYWLGRGYGVDTITENDTTTGNTDSARFEAGIAVDQLWFTKTGNNLDVSIIGTSDKFTLSNWYLGNQYHVEQFKTSDGKTLLDSKVQNLVSAMAAFAPPAAGQITLAANYATSLNPVIAANWQ